MNRRGDASIVVLVFLIATLFAASLLSFGSVGNGIQEEIQDIGAIEGVYINASIFEFNMESSIQDVFFQTYLEFIKNEEYSYINSESKIYDVWFFDFLDEDLNEEFKKLFMEKLDVEKKYKDKVSLEFEEDFFKVVFSGMEFTSNISGYFVKYSSDIVYEFNFVDQNIIGFEKLFLVKERCSSFDDILEVEDCFKKEFDNFEVGVEEVGEDKKYFNVILGKDEMKFNFLID